MRYGKTLFVGVFLAVLGAALLLAQGSTAAGDVLAQAARYWPLAIIAIGLVLIVRRTPFALVATLVAAITSGLVVGGAAIAASSLDVDAFCTHGSTDATETRSGSFGRGGDLDLEFSCGDLQVTTSPGADWRLTSLALGADLARIDQSDAGLSIATRHDGWRFGPRTGGDAWQLVLPRDVPLDIRAEINAATGDLDLTGARLGTLDAGVNASDVAIDLAGGGLETLAVEANASAVRLILPAADLTGTVAANAASIEICAPPDLGLRITSEVAFGDTTFNGLLRANGAWETPDLATAAHRADLSVEATAGSVVVNPEGGCE